MPHRSESSAHGTASQPSEVAVLLIAHGSRRAEANRDLAELASHLRNANLYPIVEVAYLELAEPTIPQGCQRCAEQGAGTVLMLPYFLSAGRHVTTDLEAFRKEGSLRYPHIDFRICPPLGLHPKMIEIVLDRLTEGHHRDACSDKS